MKVTKNEVRCKKSRRTKHKKRPKNYTFEFNDQNLEKIIFVNYDT